MLIRVLYLDFFKELSNLEFLKDYHGLAEPQDVDFLEYQSGSQGFFKGSKGTLIFQWTTETSIVDFFQKTLNTVILSHPRTSKL